MNFTDILNQFLLMGVFFCIMQLLRFLLRKDKTFSELVISGLTLSVLILCLVTWNLRFHPDGVREYIFSHLSCLDAPFHYLVGPLMYILLQEAQGSGETNRKKYLPHLIPALLVLCMALPYYLQEAEYKDLKPYSDFKDPRFMALDYIYLVSIFHLLAYFLFFSARAFPVWLAQRKQNPNSAAFLIVTIFFVTGGVAYTLCLVRFFSHERIFYLLAVALSASSVLLEFLADSRNNSFAGSFVKIMEEPKQQVRRHRLPEKDVVDLSVRLKVLMEEQKIFMDLDFNFDELVRLTNVGRHQLSEYINREENKNFRQYVNEYRIKEACRLLGDSPEASISNIGFHVGFNSLSTFNRAFSILTGRTPRGYRQSMQQSAA